MRSRRFSWLRTCVVGLIVIGVMGRDVAEAAEVEGS